MIFTLVCDGVVIACTMVFGYFLGVFGDIAVLLKFIEDRIEEVESIGMVASFFEFLRQPVSIHRFFAEQQQDDHWTDRTFKIVLKRSILVIFGGSAHIDTALSLNVIYYRYYIRKI